MDMDDQRKKAFDFAQETSKQLITLATAIIGLTVTFGKDFAGGVNGFARFLAIASWVLFLISILFGLITLMAMTGSLEPKVEAAPSIRGSNVTVPAAIQVLLFFLALVAAVWFGIVAPFSSTPTPKSAGSEAAQPTATASPMAPSRSAPTPTPIQPAAAP
jgi:hypothetical protein